MAELALSKVVWLRAHPLLPEGKGVHPSELQLGFPGGSAGKESACNAEDLGLISGLGRFPWRRERLPTPVFWPGEFHGLYGLNGVAKSQTQLSDFHFHAQ